MGKKYIIEIPDDKIGDFIGSTHFLMPYMMAGHIGHHDTGLPIKPYTEPDLEQVRKEAYEQGLSDAWEAARKVTQVRKYGGYGDCLEEVFGRHRAPWDVFDYSASECIEKIRQYEQEKEEQIQVGDEVFYGNTKGIVIRPEDGDRYASVFTAIGEHISAENKDLTKTGRHFPELVEILQKMKKS